MKKDKSLVIEHSQKGERDKFFMGRSILGKLVGREINEMEFAKSFPSTKIVVTEIDRVTKLGVMGSELTGIVPRLLMLSQQGNEIGGVKLKSKGEVGQPKSKSQGPKSA
ncbi:hypothetical protein ACFE04_027257 [Oxalis oulophora]